ncbi:hypothetical protein Leryth_016108 [Lithospermum erythrorhizon]|nr:hypothetical protein Leryth_016108 [Lithospermum erythrorhizon]
MRKTWLVSFKQNRGYWWMQELMRKAEFGRHGSWPHGQIRGRKFNN